MFYYRNVLRMNFIFFVPFFVLRIRFNFSRALSIAGYRFKPVPTELLVSITVNDSLEYSQVWREKERNDVEWTWVERKSVRRGVSRFARKSKMDVRGEPRRYDATAVDFVLPRRARHRSVQNAPWRTHNRVPINNISFLGREAERMRPKIKGRGAVGAWMRWGRKMLRVERRRKKRYVLAARHKTHSTADSFGCSLDR